jgi:hypothetical protein
MQPVRSQQLEKIRRRRHTPTYYRLEIIASRDAEMRPTVKTASVSFQPNVVNLTLQLIKPSRERNTPSQNKVNPQGT